MASKLERKDINLLPLILKKKELSAQSKRTRGMVITLVFLVLVLGGLVGKYLYEMNDINQQKAELEAYLLDPAVIAEYTEAVEAREITLQAQKQAVALSNLFAALDRVPQLSSKQFATIEELCGNTLVIDDIYTDMSNRRLDIKLLGLHPEDISPFVAKLRANDMVESVSYNGYSSQNTIYYYFSISCYLKEVAVDE